MNFYISDSSDHADVSAIHDALYTFNLSKTGAQRAENVAAVCHPQAASVIVRNGAGEFCGGAAYHWLDEPRHVQIDYFFMHDSLRGNGWGQRIFDHLEELVRACNGEYIIVTTNSFQAPGFYRKLGFEQISEKAAPCPLIPDNIHYKFRKLM